MVVSSRFAALLQVVPALLLSVLLPAAAGGQAYLVEDINTDRRSVRSAGDPGRASRSARRFSSGSAPTRTARSSGARTAPSRGPSCCATSRPASSSGCSTT